ncbi:MAG: protease complex subunit PrcB family protein [Fimbriimonadaceae bacterium]
MRLLYAFALLVLVGTCPAQVNPLPGIDFGFYQGGEQSKIMAEQNRIILTEGDFQSYWREHTGQAVAPRDINWRTHFAIAVHLGKRTTTGYKVMVQSMERTRGGEIEVVVAETTPPDGIYAQVMTSPWEIILVKRLAGEIKFRKTTRPSSTVPLVPQVQTCPWTTLQSDITGGGARAFEQLISSERELGEYWKRTFGEVPPPTTVDFSREMIIVIHLGNQPSNGYAVLVEQVRMVSNGIVVSYIKQAPSKNQRVKKAATSPYVIILVPKFQGRATFESRTWNSEG